MRESDPNTFTTCRPTKLLLALAGAFLVFTILAAAGQFVPGKNGPPTVGMRLFLAAVIAGTFGFALHLVLLVCRYRIVATGSGLRWRGAWGNWRSLPWNTVTDFYDEVRIDTLNTRPVRCPTIVTDSVKLKVSPDCIGLDDFRRVVREQATAARLTEWEPLGVRRVDDWPQTFGYWDESSGCKIAAGAACCVTFLAVVGFALVRLYSWASSLLSPREALPVAAGLLFGFLAFFTLFLMKVWQWRSVWKRRDELFTTTPETIRYEKVSTGTFLEVPWSEISDYFYGVRNEGLKHEGFTLVLKGADERTIHWNRELLRSGRLLAIVQRYASKPAFMTGENAVWRNRSDHEKTGGSDPATWQGGAIGMGGRVFQNRSISSRILLVFSTLTLTIFPFAAIHEWNKPAHGQYMGPIQIMGILLMPLVWGWVCYFRTRVETDDMGITHFTPFGKRFVPWFAVADYTDVRSKSSTTRQNTEGDPTIVTGRDGKRMFFWSTLNGYEELRSEIERYAPPPKTGWKK